MHVVAGEICSQPIIRWQQPSFALSANEMGSLPSWLSTPGKCSSYQYKRLSAGEIYTARRASVVIIVHWISSKYHMWQWVDCSKRCFPSTRKNHKILQNTTQPKSSRRMLEGFFFPPWNKGSETLEIQQSREESRFYKAPAKFRAPLGFGALFFNRHHSPALVWMVAPVTSSTSSGLPFNWTSNFCSSKVNTMTDSISANWSPTHLRGPPPNGRKAKSEITCVTSHVHHKNGNQHSEKVNSSIQSVSLISNTGTSTPSSERITGRVLGDPLAPKERSD